MSPHRFVKPATPFGTTYSGDPCANCGEPAGALIHAVDHAETLRRVAAMIGRISIGAVDSHVGSGEPHFASHIQCDDWAELDAMFAPFRVRVTGNTGAAPCP